jgi:AcrR family transcriptional regulator
MSNADSTIATILAAAETLFVQNAYADVSMRELAHAANVSTGALYHHFPSKEKLYYAMFRAYMDRMRGATLAATPPDGSCRARLRALTRVFLSLPPNERQVMGLVRRDVNVFRGRLRAGLVRAYQGAVPELVEAVLADAIRRKELRKQDARWLAWAYVAIVETTLGDYAQETLGSVERQLDAVLDLFLRGAASGSDLR